MNYGYSYYCRWDQKQFRSKKPLPKGGFCSGVCKQAHYRAYKKYVTQRRAAGGPGPDRRVTQKKRKKSKRKKKDWIL